jgi:hypothetical protein
MRALLCSVVLFFSPASAVSQQVIINELFNSSSTNEWVELVVVADGLDLRGWDLRDFSSGGTPQDPLEFLPVPLWSNLEAGTIIIAARPDSLIPEDLDPSDFLLRVNTTNTDFFDGPLFVFAGSSDAIQIRDTSDGHVFGLSWGDGNVGSLSEPRVHFDETSASNTAASFSGDSTGQATSTSHWLWDNASPSPGMGNSTANTAWIDSLRTIVASLDATIDTHPATHRLMQNYPNPFNPQTRIVYAVGSTPARPDGQEPPGRSGGESVVLAVYDVLGREVVTLVNERKEAGTYSVSWDAAGLPSGVYLYRLSAGGFVETKKLVLLR